MRRARIFISVVLAGLLALMPLVLCSCRKSEFSAEMREEMKSAVDEVISREDIPGAVVGVWIPDRGNWVYTKGVSDIETGGGIETGYKFRIASNTKPFVATVILQLVDEGKLSLDDKLAEFVPGFTYGNKITIRQLCNMTSGVYSFTEDEQFQKSFESDPLMQLTPQQEIDIALRHRPYFFPGLAWHYSDTNYTLLGIIIEQVTGNKVAEELEERIFEPLDLDSTTFPETPEMPDPHSKGYVLKGGELVDYTNINPLIPWTGGAMISDLQDMRTWAKVLANGEIVSGEMHEEQFDWVSTGVDSMKYGLGVVNIHGFVGHHGAIFGYNSVFFHLPRDDATIVVMVNKSTNDSNESSDIFLELARVIYPKMFEK